MLVQPLSAFSKADLLLAGGKGANLGELVRAGFPVPDGFVVTTEAYSSVVGSYHASEEGASIRSAIEALQVPSQLDESIRKAYADLGGGPVAVRSSATAEDLPGAAFAGQQDTYLNIVGPSALIDAVRRCWASLWTDRAIAYRSKLGIDPAEVSIAVVVQSMVEAEFAGVMFTADPVTGERRHIVVDASSGLGEAVVSGLVTPDHYVLDVSGKVLDWSPGRREVVIRSTSGGGVSHDSGSASDPERLSEDALKELAALGSRVAEHFGRPQDIEWAYAGGQVRLLQARPMTALPPPPVRLNRVRRKLGSILLEYLPVRPYPMDVSTWLPYGPAGLMGSMLAFYGIRGPFDDFLRETDGVVDRLVPNAPHPTPRLLGAPFRLVSRVRRYDPARWTSDPRFVAYLEQVGQLAARDMSTMPWEELIRVPQQAFDLVRPVTDLRVDYLPRAGVSLLRLAVTLALLGRADLRSDLVAGARTRTEDANRALEALADLVREDAALREVVDALDVRRLKEFGEFHARFSAFLREYGHRETATPLLVSPPTWGESPETVLGLVKVLVGGSSGNRSRAREAMRSLLELPALRNPRRRARVLRRVEAAQAGMAFREDTHFYFTMPLPILRRALLEMGRRLCDAAIVKQAEDVFQLRLEELREAGDPARLPEPVKERLRALVLTRAARRDELTGVRLIDPAAIFPPPRDRGDALVSGTPASAGVVTGPVRVIRSADDFAKLESGEVLVCSYTNPSWTPLFQRAVAVVVDSGATASHAAIVAREYGIPAIMGTASGTTVLSDGQLVTVDGGTGRVTAAS